MSAAALALQAAIKDRLAADAGLSALLGGPRIHEGSQRPALMPYVSLDEILSRDRGGVAAPLAEHRLVLRIWSKTGTRDEALSIADRVALLLDDAALAPAGHRLVSLRLDQQDLRFGKDRVIETILRFRALTEPL